ncbi:Family transcriptional regulator [Hyella patelloides LEGE 07179]|uniref:Family transcriptional regulator n=1 Tax=Hyella patelloides LEGE 07179 TaxID=945734 RepID=A0A563VLR7_9CYAN|nr:GntR family transcriptional regulator [Hyella patelloides]VEP12390.1 Family transcriptional regulator [Hyella patelloides LEGE 07179]
MTRSQKQIPLHLNISEQIQQRIISGYYLPGTKLPSERKLIEEWKVSRITIRRAIANLVQQGLVTTHQGKGAFVTEKHKVAYTLSSPLTFLQNDLANKGIGLSLQNITFELVTATAELQKILQLPSNNPTAYLQKKLLLTDNVPGGVDITYILPEIGQKLATELKQNMTFPVLERNNWKIERVAAIIECTNANLELSEYLDVSLGHPLLVYRHTAYTTHNHPLVHGETISRGDRFCYSVEQFS